MTANLRIAALIFGAAVLGVHGDDYLHSSARDTGLLFYSAFDGVVKAQHAGGETQGALIGNEKAGFAGGLRGQGIRLGIDPDGEKHALWYSGARNMDHEQGTISFWVKPETWKPSDKDFHVLTACRLKDMNFFIYKLKDKPALCFFIGGDEQYQAVNGNISKWVPGEWHHVAATWDKEAMRLYLDGVYCGSAKRPELPESGVVKIHLGYSWSSENGCSIMDEFKIFNRPLEDTEIAGEHALFAGKSAASMNITVGEKRPALDGVVQADEYAMSGAGFNDIQGRYALRQGRYHLAHDEKYIYAALVTPQETMPATNADEHDAPVWRDDCCEIWLSRDGRDKYQIIFNAGNGVFDAKYTEITDRSWTAQGLQIVNQIKDGFWTAEVAVPKAILGDGEDWKINLCRTYQDENREIATCIAPVRHPFSYADLPRFAALKLVKESPDYAIDSLGKINQGNVDLKARTTQPVTAQYSDTHRTHFKAEFKPDNGVVNYSGQFVPAGCLELSIAGLFNATYQGRPFSPVGVQYFYTDIKNKTLISSVKNEFGEQGGEITVLIKERQGAREYRHSIRIAGDKVYWEDSWDISEIPPGDYDYEALYTDASGKSAPPFRQWYRIPPEKPEWEDNTVGIFPGEVPPPWQPLQVGEDRVSMLMQSYGFQNSLFPTSFIANQHEILSRGCEFKVNGRPVECQSFKLIEAKPDYAVFEAGGEHDGAMISCRIRAEYDGMLWYSILLRGQAVNIEEIILDIPLDSKYAGLVHSCADRDAPHRVAFGATGLVPRDGWHKNLYFKPAFWVGSDEAGLAWYAETLSGWRVNDKNRSVEILPRGGETIVRLNIVNCPFLLQGERKIEFGLHGTPVKKSLPRAPRIGIVSATKYFNYFDGGDEFFDKDYWDNVRKNFKTKLGIDHIFLNFCSNGGSPFSPEWGWFGKLWTSREIGNNIIEGNFSTEALKKKWIWTMACHNSKSFREFVLWQLSNVLTNKEWGVSNMYYDLVGPSMCSNPEHGCGWVDDDGVKWPTHNIRGNREFHKRIYHFISKHIPGCLHNYHISGQPVVPAVHSFADMFTDGETTFGGEVTVKESYIGILTPEFFRTAYWGCKWGYPVCFDQQLSRSANPDRKHIWSQNPPSPEVLRSVRHLIGYAYAHDVTLWGGTKALHDLYRQLDLELGKQFFSPLDEQAKFIPYWSANKPFDVTHAAATRLMASAWLKDGKCLMVIMNDTDQEQPVTIRYPGVKSVITQDGRTIELEDDVFQDQIPARNFKLFLIHP